MSNDRKRMRSKAHRIKRAAYFARLHKGLIAMKISVLKMRDAFWKLTCIMNGEIQKAIAELKAWDELRRRNNQ